MEYSAIKMNEIRPRAGTCMERKTVILSEVSQIEENKHQMINLREKNALIYKTETHRLRKQIYGFPREKVGWG